MLSLSSTTPHANLTILHPYIFTLSLVAKWQEERGFVDDTGHIRFRSEDDLQHSGGSRSGGPVSGRSNQRTTKSKKRKGRDYILGEVEHSGGSGDEDDQDDRSAQDLADVVSENTSIHSKGSVERTRRNGAARRVKQFVSKRQRREMGLVDNMIKRIRQNPLRKRYRRVTDGSQDMSRVDPAIKSQLKELERRNLSAEIQAVLGGDTTRLEQVVNSSDDESIDKEKKGFVEYGSD